MQSAKITDMKIQVVNEQDEIIGVKERTEIDYAIDIYRHTKEDLVALKEFIDDNL